MARRRGTKRAATQAVEPTESDVAAGESDTVANQTEEGQTAVEADQTESNRPRETSATMATAVVDPVKSINGTLAESDSSDEVSEDSDVALNGTNGGADAWRDGEEDEEEEDEEEILVVCELADFKNHPILDDYKAITIEGIDTPKPTLHIGEYSLHGQLEETVGTHYFYDTKNRTEDNEYRFAGQTMKKIKFTIAPPDEY